MKDKSENDGGNSAPPRWRAAVIGLGSMGSGMALSLLRAGFDVCGCDANAAAMERFAAQGGAAATTPAEAAKGADVVVSVVVNAAQTEAAAAALQMFLMAAGSGMGRDDDASVARVYARLSGTPLPGEAR